jgi:GAF domain/AMIN domain
LRSDSNLAVKLQAPTPELQLSSTPGQAQNAVLQALVITAQVLTGSVGVCLALFTYGKLLCQGSAGLGPPLGTFLDAATGVVGTCVRTRSPGACPDIELQEASDRDRYRALGIRSLLIAPIRWPDGELAGVLEAFYHEPNGFSADEDLQCLSLVSAAMTGVICGEKVATKAGVGEITQPSLAFPNPSPISTAPWTGPELLQISDETGMHGLESRQDPRVVRLQHILSHLSTTTAWDDIRTQILAACDGVALSAAPPDQTQLIPTTGSVLEREVTLASANKEQDRHDKPPAQEDAVRSITSSYSPTRTEPRPWSAIRLTLVVVLLATVVLELAGLLVYELGARGSSPYVVAGAQRPGSGLILQKPAAEPHAQAAAPQSLTVASTTTDEVAKVTAIQHYPTRQPSTVLIAVDGRTTYDVHRLSHPERVYIDFSNTTLAHELDGKSFAMGEPCLRKYRAGARGPRLSRVTIETGGFCDYTAVLTRNPSALRLELQPYVAGRGTGAHP